MHYDLTDPEYQRYEVREPDSVDPIANVQAFHVADGWLEISTPAAPVEVEVQDIAKDYKRRRPQKAAQASPAILRITRDFDVYDRISEATVFQIRRKL